MSEKTIGALRVQAEFNPTKNGFIDQIKNKSAELINLLEEQKKFPGGDPVGPEKMRVIALAQTEIETACMYAVKSQFTAN